MSARRKNEVMVGIVTLVATGLLIALIFLLGGLDRWLESTAEVRIRFHDVHGLKVGDPVYLFGLKAGTVQALALRPHQPDERATIELTIEVPLEDRPHIRRSTVARIDKSLTGSLSVILNEAPDDLAETLPEGEVLVARENREIGEILADVDTLVSDGKGVVADVAAFASSLREGGRIEKVLSEAESLARRVNDRLGPLADSADDAMRSLSRLVSGNEERVAATLAKLDETTGLARDLIADLDGAPARLESTLEELRAASDQIGRLVEDNRAGIGLIVDDLTDTAANAEHLTAEVKRRPWRLLYRPSIEEQEAQELYDAAWAYNLGAAELHRSALVLAERLDGPRGDAAQEALLDEAAERVRRSLESQRDAEERFWRLLRESDDGAP